MSHFPIGKPLLLCFSHLRWDFVFQRPQQLMTRLADRYRIIFWEEPILAGENANVERRIDRSGVEIVVPHLPETTSAAEADTLIATLLTSENLERVAVRWFYSPMMLPPARGLVADCTVYDCMDELANFRFAPPSLLALEDELFGTADIVFTGGYSLYEAKRGRHADVRPFPSSVDIAHFSAARRKPVMTRRGVPKLGFYGVIDERMDLDLLERLATARPEWDIEIVGPVVKIATEDLPVRSNLHYMGSRSYDELVDVLAEWDVALMPFAINEATRFISPTKTPEYLAGGRPVVSTDIVDVRRHYGRLSGVRIAADPGTFITMCDEALAMGRSDERWLAEADVALAAMSWDVTTSAMADAIEAATARRKPKSKHYDVMVVGAGFAGAVMAERLARDAGLKVLVVDKRPHIAGNAFDRLDAAGILIHQYGPHIFHTNSDEIVDYLSHFTEWRSYEHRVLADVDGKQVPMPINRTTLNRLYDAGLADDDAAGAFLSARAEPVSVVRTSEDVVVGAVGRDLYEKFFRGYTRKQWGLDPSELDKSVTARVPTRTNIDDRYFTDSFQAMPVEGYTAMFKRMLDHPNIEVLLGVEHQAVRDLVDIDHLVFTGPIDEYFGHRFGRLPYRSLRFRHETLAQEWLQPVATVNYPEEAVPYTRITEYKHLTGQSAPVTSITYEYPTDDGDPYYPVPRAENQALFKRYEALADAEDGVTFVGRLATYRYYNMDQVVGQALATYRRLKATLAATDDGIEEVA